MKLPKITCPSGCHKCCQPVAITYAEAERLGIPGQFWTGARPDGKCRFLDDEKGCTQYENRPLICRAFGAARCGIFQCRFLPVQPPGVELIGPEESEAIITASMLEGAADGSLLEYFRHPECLRVIHEGDIREGFAPSPLYGAVKELQGGGS